LNIDGTKYVLTQGIYSFLTG